MSYFDLLNDITECLLDKPSGVYREHGLVRHRMLKLLLEVPVRGLIAMAWGVSILAVIFLVLSPILLPFVIVWLMCISGHALAGGIMLIAMSLALAVLIIAHS